MASQKLFENIPPFPDDVPVIDMHRIRLADLIIDQDGTAEKLFDACRKLGFFLLDLRGHTLGETMIGEIEDLWAFMRELMDLPTEVNAKYHFDPPQTFFGFKSSGETKTETKQPDRYAYWNFAQDGLLGNTPLQPLPDIAFQKRDLLASFLRHGQTIISCISSCLAQQLSLPASTFTDLQDPSRESGTMVRFIKSDASPDDADLRTSLMHHTDFGTVTLLVNVLGGLQVLAPGYEADERDGWRFVRPQPGCLIINLGDAMTAWTGGVLRSNCHRIYYAPGEQRFVDRYSMVLLARPEKQASMRPLVGDAQLQGEQDDITAWEWEKKKATAMKEGRTFVRSKGGVAIETEA